MRREATVPSPAVDLVGAIGFRKFGYGGEPNRLPLDPARTYASRQCELPVVAGRLNRLPREFAAGIEVLLVTET